MKRKIPPSQLKLLLEEEKKKEAERQRWKYTHPCKYCNIELSLNSAGEEIGVHDCRPGRDMWQKAKIDGLTENKQHNMLLHGFLQAVQLYASFFGLESTAACVLKSSGITKEDLIRCQIQSGWKSDIMLPLIEKAFAE